MSELDQFRSLFCYDDGLGFSLDLSALGVARPWISARRASCDAALDAMAALEGGAIANPDEGRRVGHYWLRAPHLAPDPSIAAGILATRDSVESFAADIHRGNLRPERGGRFTRALLVGIGGSALGPQFLSRALAPPRPPVELAFLDNTDPEGIEHALARLGDDLASTLVLVVSKSGTTPETRNGALKVREAFADRGLNFPRHAVAITGEGSALDREAKREGWIAAFPMHDWVGGRTSVASAVGLLPMALEGIDFRSFLAGAAAMDVWTRRRDVFENPGLLLALGMEFGCDGKGARDMVVLPYRDRLELLGRYLQQLVMESLGKELDLEGRTVHQGLAVYGNKGSTDQHAFVQQLRDGVDNFFVVFIEVLRDDEARPVAVDSEGCTAGDYLAGFLLGTRRALSERGRRSLTATVPDASPRSVGALVALFERAVGFYGSMAGINPYHQPGVEAGKLAAREALALQGRILGEIRAAEAGIGFPDLAVRLRPPSEADLFRILRRLVANGRIRFRGEGLFDGIYSSNTRPD